VIVDTSAIIAALIGEPGFEAIEAHLQASPALGVGAPTLVEAGLVLGGKMGVLSKTLLARFVEERGMTVIPFGPAHWSAALDAFLRYGKGRHPAGLNLGDCMTYATVLLAGEPLLCLGNDFAQTDLQLVS